mmetsp:Transcript_67182/g.160922  ORF Transcript_67182/g.160922 Transcript_67182/m.160922 type:complete len:200 (-) Transcript_67182:1110-1709(-)
MLARRNIATADTASCLSLGSPSVMTSTARDGMTGSPKPVLWAWGVDRRCQALRRAGVNFVSPVAGFISCSFWRKSSVSLVRGQTTSSSSSNLMSPRRTPGKEAFFASTSTNAFACWNAPLSEKADGSSVPITEAGVFRARKKEAELSRHTTKSRGAFCHCPSCTLKSLSDMSRTDEGPTPWSTPFSGKGRTVCVDCGRA